MSVWLILSASIIATSFLNTAHGNHDSPVQIQISPFLSKSKTIFQFERDARFKRGDDLEAKKPSLFLEFPETFFKDPKLKKLYSSLVGRVDSNLNGPQATKLVFQIDPSKFIDASARKKRKRSLASNVVRRFRRQNIAKGELSNVDWNVRGGHADVGTEKARTNSEGKLIKYLTKQESYKKARGGNSSQQYQYDRTASVQGLRFMSGCDQSSDSCKPTFCPPTCPTTCRTTTCSTTCSTTCPTTSKTTCPTTCRTTTCPTTCSTTCPTTCKTTTCPTTCRTSTTCPTTCPTTSRTSACPTTCKTTTTCPTTCPTSKTTTCPTTCRTTTCPTTCRTTTCPTTCKTTTCPTTCPTSSSSTCSTTCSTTRKVTGCPRKTRPELAAKNFFGKFGHKQNPLNFRSKRRLYRMKKKRRVPYQKRKFHLKTANEHRPSGLQWQRNKNT